MTSREDFPGTDEWYEARGMQKPSKNKVKPEPITAHTESDVRRITNKLDDMVVELAHELNMTTRTVYHIIRVNLHKDEYK
jgi:hypothetical protein